YEPALRRVQPQQLRHQRDRFRAWMTVRAADLRHVEDVLQAIDDLIGSEHVRRPSTGVVRLVGLVAIEALAEDASFGAMKGVGAVRLLAVAPIAPWDPRLIV